jgi:hypothetical protein
MSKRKEILNDSDSVQSDADLLAHIRSLGLNTVEDYRRWCDRHGFSRRTQKHWRQRLKERAAATRAEADRRLARRKLEVRKPKQVIAQICDGSITEDLLTQPHFAAICRVLRSAQDNHKTKLAAQRLFLHLSGSELLSSNPVIAELGWQLGNSYVEAVGAFGRFAHAWVRPPEDWGPKTHNVKRQFASLARHLFAEWPVPAFMDAVWFKGNSEEGLRQQRWFLHVGRGENIRHADVPIPFTKRMAHHFMQAPSDLTVEAAVRWGQIHALGGHERLVRAVIGTRLEKDFSNNDFWTSVLRWLIEHPLLDVSHVGPLIDYLNNQRFTPQETLVDGVVRVGPPPQPNFTMRGRSPETLLRLVEQWHHKLSRRPHQAADWLASGITPFEFVEGSHHGGNRRIWTIQELLSTKALMAEGRAMKHCVGSYASSCSRGVSSIWTLEVEEAEGVRKVLTIEVNRQARLICQARGKCNAPPGDKHRSILQRWASQAGLALAKHA